MSKILATSNSDGIECNETIIAHYYGSGGITPSGNINITTTSQIDVTNYATAQILDSSLIASNIKRNVNILGVIGTYGSGGISPSGTINITTTSAIDVTDYAIAQVVDSDLVASNIKDGVNILGITGTYSGGGITPSGTITITSNGIYNITNYATANINLETYNGEVE